MTHYYRIRDGKRCVEPAFCRAPQCDCAPATRQEIVADLRRRADALDRDAGVVAGARNGYRRRVRVG